MATVSHSSLVDRVLARLDPGPRGTHPGPRGTHPDPRGTHPDRRRVPRWGSVADPEARGAGLSTAPVVGVVGADALGVVGADAIGPGAVLNAVGTRELAGRLPTLVVATGIKLVPAEVFGRLGGAGFEAVPLEAVAAVVVGNEVLSPAEAGRRAQALGPGPG